MHIRFNKTTTQILSSGLVSLALVAGVASGILAHTSGQAHTASAAVSLNGGLLASSPVRSVNTATLKTASAKIAATKQKSLNVDRLLRTPAQISAARSYAEANPSKMPQAVSSAAPLGSGSGGISPNLFNGGNLGLVQKQVEGLTYSNDASLYSGEYWYPPDQAMAAGNKYAVEGVNNVFAIYDVNLNLVGGPFSTAQFFGNTSDSYSDPQITFDQQRRVWVISTLEITSSGDLVDIAISQTSSPIGFWWVYQFNPATINSDYFCDYDTLGYSWMGLYVTCPIFSNSTGHLITNLTIMAPTDKAVAGSGFSWAWWTGLKLDNGSPAYRFSPAMEDGSPQGEWIAATDVGYLGTGTSKNLTLCSVTNEKALDSSTLPTFTCKNTALPIAYSDDNTGGVQPGTTSLIYGGDGFKQIAYRNGQLAFALPMTMSCSGTTRTGIMWAEVTPQLSTFAAHNPQQVTGIVSNFSQANYWCYNKADYYMPTLMATSEGDLGLVYNFSSSTSYPGIAYTVHANTDAPNTMGEGNASKVVVNGVHSNDSGRWGDYSACTLTSDTANPGSRGIIYCGGEYGGPDDALGGFAWDTYMYDIRLE